RNRSRRVFSSSVVECPLPAIKLKGTTARFACRKASERAESAQRFAREPQPPASLLERFHRRGEGNPNERRQSIRVALNQREILRFEQIHHEIGVARDDFPVWRLLANDAGA